MLQTGVPMARSQYSPTLSVAPEISSGDDYQHIQASPDAFGAQIGQAEQGLGRMGQAVGNETLDLATKYAQQATEASANDIIGNQYGPAIDKLSADYRQLKGKQAIEGYDSHIAAVHKLSQGYLEQAKKSGNMELQNMLSGYMARQNRTEVEAATRWHNAQDDIYQKESYSSFVDHNSNYAVQNYTDANALANAKTSMRGAIIARSIDEGQPREYGEQQFKKQWNKTLTGVFAQKIDADPYQALKELKQGGQVHSDDALLDKISQVESGGNPNAVNKNSGAAGTFQFMTATGAQYGLSADDRFDPVKSRTAAGRLLSDNRTSLTQSLGRAPTAGELYLAHQQGAGGAAALLKNPDANAVDVVGEKAVLQNGGTADMTAGEFAKKWNDKIGDRLASDLDPITRSKLIVHAENQIRRHQTSYQASLNERIKNSTVMAAQGVADPNPPSAQDFVAAFGDEQGLNNYQQYQKTQQFAQDVNDVQVMTPDEQRDLLNLHEPQAGADFSTSQERYQVLADAVEHVNQDRATDPVAYGQRAGIMPEDKLDLMNGQKLTEQLSQRESVSQIMADKFGTPEKVLNKDEAAFLSKQMQSMPASGRLQLLKSINDGVSSPESYRMTMQQIRPDSPVTAVAGGFLGYQRLANFPGGWFSDSEMVAPNTVATRLLQGEDLLNPPKNEKGENGVGKSFPMPSDTTVDYDMRGAFNETYGAIFSGQPEQANQMYQATRAYYASLASEGGDFSGKANSTLYEQAMRDVVGRPVEQRNSIALPPWGMPEDIFLDSAKTRFDALKSERQDLSAINFDDVGLQNTPVMGRYVLRAGNGYLLDKSGRPIVLDLNPQQTALPSGMAVTRKTMPDFPSPTHKAPTIPGMKQKTATRFMDIPEPDIEVPDDGEPE